MQQGEKKLLSDVRRSRPAKNLARLLSVAMMMSFIPFGLAGVAEAAPPQCAFTGGPYTVPVGQTITATVQFSNTTTNTVVTFSVTPTIPGPNSNQPTVTPTVTTNDNTGLATTTVRSTNVGSTTLKAQDANGTFCFQAVTWTQIQTAGSITLSPQTATNTVDANHTVTATVLDPFNNRVASGATVTFTASGTTAETPGQSVTQTDSNGVATYTFTSSLRGTSSITATAQGTSGPVTSSAVTKKWTAKPPNAVALTQGANSIAPATNTVGAPHKVTATVTDINGNSVNDGTLVTFTVAGDAPQSGTRTTTGGIATFTFTATQPGTSNITATSGTAPTSNTLVKNWVTGPAALITLSPTSDTKPVGATETITATVTDQFGNLVGAGQVVSFTVSGAGAQTGSATTGANSVATFTFTSIQSGNSFITATTSSGATSNTSQVTWTAGPVTGYRVTAPSPVNTEQCFQITVQAIDANGNPTTGADTVALTTTAPDIDGSQMRIFDDAGCTHENALLTLSGGTGTRFGSDANSETVTVRADQVGGTRTGTTTVVVVPGPPRSLPAVWRSGRWFLRNALTSGIATTEYNFGGSSGDIPVFGDWNGDGVKTPGVYRPSTGTWFLKNTNVEGPADITFQFGSNTDRTPVAGNWDGVNGDSIGFYRGGTWILRNTNSTGAADATFNYGLSTDQEVVGDWDGNGTDTVGVFRSSTGHWFERNTNSAGGTDTEFAYGTTGDTPLAGDWNRDGVDTPAIYRSSAGTWHLRNFNSTGSGDISFSYGLSTDTALVWSNGGA